MKKRRIIHALSVLIIAGIFASCSESDIGTSSDSNLLVAGNIEALGAQKSHGDSPQKVFFEFQEMRKKVETMSKTEIDSLSDEEILTLAEPILKAADGNTKHSKKTLKSLEEPLAAISDNAQTLTEKEHAALSKEVEQILASDTGRKTRDLNAEDIRELLIALNSGRTTMMLSGCETTFDVTPSGQVLLYTGDNFNMANGICPAGSTFYVQAGTHTGQYVSSSRTGNSWVGVGSGGPTMDGQNSLNWAFNDGMNSNSISWIEIKNYAEHGIYSDSGSDQVLIHHMTFNNIAPVASGQRPGENNSAIRFDNAEDIEVSDSYFEDVASSIRVRFSDGPIKIVDNEALNSGRNFFQCNTCIGGGIRINGNSMDRTSAYGNTELEDWINILESEGLSNDWIQVNNNRARGHSNRKSGSMIILGDAGGKFQEAVGNIGVNPGQVGIGAPEGHNMKVEGNKMYSEQWTYSNTAYYSKLPETTVSCSNHEFPASPNPNLSNWTCGWSGTCPVGNTWRAWAPPSPDPNCGIDFNEIRDNVNHDSSVDEDVWNDW